MYVCIRNWNYHCTLEDLRQDARNFLISASFPGKNFSDKWVRCLNGFVSTTFRNEGVWSKLDPEETSCSKNLKRKKISHITKCFSVEPQSLLRDYS